MKDILNNLISEMIEYEKGNPRRVQHFLKVHAFAKIIAEQEGLDERTQDTLEIAAVLHDIGIKPSVKNMAPVPEITRKSRDLLWPVFFKNITYPMKSWNASAF